VVPVRERGYGAAIKGGIGQAKGDYIIFADADGSYMLEHALPLYKKAVEAGADMVVASRLRGAIEPGAMPFLHRYLGTPVLTLFINMFFKGALSDCNSGFRCIRRKSFHEWDIRSDGMEFASELLIKALKHGAKIVEIPSGLRRDRRERPPHLRTWRDGMRHLLFILSEKPQIMEVPGFLLLSLSSVLQVAALAAGPTALGKFNIFDYHTHALLLMLGCIGTQMYLLGCSIYVFGNEKPMKLTRRILDMDEARLFFLLMINFTVCSGTLGWIFLVWIHRNFEGLNLINPILVIIHFILIAGFMSIGLLGINILKKAR
jgi:glycosyltransferase involved in cell wall biosynthesis